MTKLPPAVGSVKNHEKVIGENEETKRLDLNSDIMNKTYSQVQKPLAQNVIDLGSSDGQAHNNFHITTNILTSDGSGGELDEEDSVDDDDDYNNNNNDSLEPLGYHSFLYDVNIEYSPGGNLSGSLSNKHCFKMKCLPYMVESDRNELLGLGSFSIDEEDNTSDMIDCDRRDERYICKSNQDAGDNQSDSLNASQRSSPIDVTKETCAFLGNSDYVPNSRNKSRRVVLELVSAKLSQSSGYTIPPNSSFNNLVSLAEDGPSSTIAANTTNSNTSNNNSETSSLKSYNSHSSARITSHPQNTRSQAHLLASKKATPSPPTTSPISSKKFVNYTILIKTVPGLDKFPAVVERRFSDFLSLYQGLKSNEALADIVDRNVTFPKKVYMGNFSLEKIAERSIEFTRLLHLCMSEFTLLWSVPFISFLIDKELKEAHRLALFGDPDDVQALIETAYYIEQKLYMRFEPSARSSTSSSSLDLQSNHQSQIDSPTLPNRKPTPSPNRATRDQTISAIHGNGSINNHNNAQRPKPTPSSGEPGDKRLSCNNSICGASYSSSRVVIDKSILAPINQRILVTFCMLFVTYCRTNNYIELKLAVHKFGRLIASQEYIDSLINTRHYNSLKACLLFLMNMTQGNVIDDSLRLQLKRRLEDIDGANADLAQNPGGNGTEHRDSNQMSSRRGRNDNVVSKRDSTRIIKNDLTSLLRDRNFCLFQS
uniref:Sorting nexin-20 n=1 Tax=Aceria tosichella TaxID=561515 RepID=A0A6G1S4V3_9ACAR